MKTKNLSSILGRTLLGITVLAGSYFIGCSDDSSKDDSKKNVPAISANRKPVISIATPITLREGDPIDFNQYVTNGSITDADGNPITLSAELCNPNGINCSSIPANYQNPIDNNPNDVAKKIRLTANDGNGGITESIIDLDIKNIYNPVATTKRTLSSGLEATVLKKGIEVKTGRKSNSSIGLDSNEEPVIGYYSVNTVTGKKSIKIMKQQNNIWGEAEILVMWNPEGYNSIAVIPNTVDNRDDIHMSFTTSTDNGQNLYYFNDKKNSDNDLGELTTIKTNNTGLENAIAMDSNDKVHIAYNYKNGGVGRLGYAENSSGNFVSQDLGNASGQVSIIIDDNNYTHIAVGYDVESDYYTTEPAGVSGCIDDNVDNYNPFVYRDQTNTYSKIAAQGNQAVNIYSNQSGWALENAINHSPNFINKDSKLSGTTDANGNVYLAYIVDNTSTGKRELWVATDKNGGENIKIGDNYANPSITIKGNGDLYVTATYAEGTGSNTANNSLEYIIVPHF